MHKTSSCRATFVPNKRDSRSRITVHQSFTESSNVWVHTKMAHSNPASPVYRSGTIHRDEYTFGMVARKHFRCITLLESCINFICNLNCCSSPFVILITIATLFLLLHKRHFQHIKHCWETASKFICNLDRAWCSPNQASHLVRIAIVYMLLHKRISYLWFGAQYNWPEVICVQGCLGKTLISIGLVSASCWNEIKLVLSDQALDINSYTTRFTCLQFNRAPACIT